MVGSHIWIDGCRVFVDLHLGIETNLTRLHVGCKMWMRVPGLVLDMVGFLLG
jgi:hypothetical protein